MSSNLSMPKPSTVGSESLSYMPQGFRVQGSRPFTFLFRLCCLFLTSDEVSGCCSEPEFPRVGLEINLGA